MWKVKKEKVFSLKNTFLILTMEDRIQNFFLARSGTFVGGGESSTQKKKVLSDVPRDLMNYLPSDDEDEDVPTVFDTYKYESKIFSLSMYKETIIHQIFLTLVTAGQEHNSIKYLFNTHCIESQNIFLVDFPDIPHYSNFYYRVVNSRASGGVIDITLCISTSRNCPLFEFKVDMHQNSKYKSIKNPKGFFYIISPRNQE